MKQVILALLTASCVFRCDAIAQELDCLSQDERAGAALYANLQKQAYAALDRRSVDYEELKTPEQVFAYQQKLREIFVS